MSDYTETQIDLVAARLHVLDDFEPLYATPEMERRARDTVSLAKSALETNAHSGDCTDEAHTCMACWYVMQRRRALYVLGGAQGLVEGEEPMNENRVAANRGVDGAIEIITRFGGIDGAHHKQWVINQVARMLLAENYDAWVEAFCDGEDGPNTYEWDEGIAP